MAEICARLPMVFQNNFDIMQISRGETTNFSPWFAARFRLQPCPIHWTHRPPSNAPPTRRIVGRFDSHGSEKFKDEPPPSMFWRCWCHRKLGTWNCQTWLWPNVFLVATLGWFLHHLIYINAFKRIFFLPCRHQQHHFGSQMRGWLCWHPGVQVPNMNNEKPIVVLRCEELYPPHSQWEFQDPKMEVPTIYKAYVSGLWFRAYTPNR